MRRFNEEDYNGNVITVKKLQKILKDNKTAHVEKYEEAMEGYDVLVKEALAKLRTQIIRALKSEAVDADSINIFEIGSIQKPTSHESDYDKVIKKLELYEFKQVVLDENEFNNFIHDEWHWKANSEMLFANHRQYSPKFIAANS